MTARHVATAIHGWLRPHLKHMISFNTFEEVVAKAMEFGAVEDATAQSVWEDLDNWAKRQHWHDGLIPQQPSARLDQAIALIDEELGSRVTYRGRWFALSEAVNMLKKVREADAQPPSHDFSKDPAADTPSPSRWGNNPFGHGDFEEGK